MFWLTPALAVSLAAPLSLPDRAALASLRRAVAAAEGAEYQLQPVLQRFERLAPRSQIPAWRRLQPGIPSTRSGSADLAFALACYGVDYERNLHRLLLPYERWHRNAGVQHDSEVVEDLAADLAILYKKHHDAHSLRALLDLQLDGGPAEEQSSVLADLWARHSVTMLRIAAGSSLRAENIAEMLDYVNSDTGGTRAAIKEVSPLTHSSDPRVAQAARQVESFLR